MQKQTILFVLIIVLAFVGLSGGAYFLLETQKSDSSSSAKPAVDIPLESAKPTTENAQTGNSLKVQGDNTSANQASQLLSPTDFENYEQYENAESTMIQDSVVGTGPEAASGDTAAVVYKGWLTDGTLFDQSSVDDQNQITPIAFTLGSGQVIAGWEQGIFGMKVGGKRRLVIPSEFGYGPNGQGSIPASSMLIFDVELVNVEKP